MRGCQVRPVVAGVACLLALRPVVAQQTDSNVAAEPQAATLCRASSWGNKQPPSSKISITDIVFLGVLQLSAAEQDQIASSLRQRTYTSDLDGTVDEALERVRAAWQDRGYFKVQVSGYAKVLTNSPVNQRIELTVRVDEGVQYRLGPIRFLSNSNQVIGNQESLRALFPIADGDIFSRKEIAEGLEKLRQAYGEMGYINFTAVPDTSFDDEKRLAYLEINIDQGKQFRFVGVSFSGLDESASREQLKDSLLQPGQIYNEGLFELLLQKYSSLFDSCTSERQLDERAGTVAVKVGCGRCPEVDHAPMTIGEKF
jgi:outer membrane protein assembly factor BamA